MFTRVRRTNLFTFAFAALFNVLSLFLFWYVLPAGALNDAVYGPTRGLVNATLIFTVFETCFLLIFVRVAGGLRPRDVGLASSLPRALLFTVLLWVLTQIGVAFWQLGTARQISWNRAWRDPGATFVLGELAEQLFGNAFYEETAFRGFVFVQTYLFMRHRKARSPLVTALLTSQLFFALLHIPLQLLDRDSSWAELPFWILATGSQASSLLSSTSKRRTSSSLSAFTRFSTSRRSFSRRRLNPHRFRPQSSPC